MIAGTNKAKARAFLNTFFATQDTKPTADDEEAIEEYPEPAFKFQNITDEQIHRAIRRTSPHKAPGANVIPNVVLKKCTNQLVSIIGPIFRATFKLNVYPAAWKNSITLVIRKPACASYSEPGSFHPIALLDTIRKILLACVAEDLTKLAETHNLLPPNHFGCRPGHTTTDAIH